MRFQSLSLLSLAIAGASAYASNSFQDKCAGLADSIELDYPFVINIAQYYPPKAEVDITQNTTCSSYQSYQYAPIEVGFCRLNLKVATTNSSEIYVEVWLPEGWKGRLLNTGNGGLSGCIDYSTIVYGASQGFVGLYQHIGADGGHNGTSGGAFYNQPEVVTDNSWRSVYVSTVVGKSIVKQFYQQDLGKSYYVGCSVGGREGWKVVQTKPDAFDGVVVGAPAFDFYRHLSHIGFIYATLGQSLNNSLISLEQWGTVKAAALQQCDGLDGAYDGIIEDPRACKFDWTAVSCDRNSTSRCFTEHQIATAEQFFAPLAYNGTILHPTGQFHGFETELFTSVYIDFVVAWIPEIFRYIVDNDISWDPTTFTLEDGYKALKLDAGGFSANNPNITAFRERNGKVLHWHGTADPLLSTGVSDTYYASVQDFFNATTADLDAFYRYFRVSGVEHCYGGPGANVLGQDGDHISGFNAEDNLITRIVEWVEEGKAPQFVRGTKYVNDVVGGDVAFTRKHCKVPLVNVYSGIKDGADEDGWECVEKE